jgi:DNA-binding transcriptional regulator YiaG
MSPSQIRALRLRLKLTTDEFADLLGFTSINRASIVTRWETGKRHPGTMARKVLKQIADQNGCAQ